jgi:hypothetical protein
MCDMMSLILPPAFWLIGYALYSRETRALPVTRFWLSLTFAMALMAVSAAILRLFLSDATNDQPDKVFRILYAAALAPIFFWFAVSAVRGK